ncbi:MAG: rRNA maturation RNAse YbeY [Candidatus Fermentibacteraceae bacterium]|nr:rRNA maturation RNAse YbeY [Candidatus Fermentibacteraceae bacterium]MBN2608167.1 rRNA maturation RNAse YbeY [Candidatus Fermentibacteraceae bacterium]
MAQVVILLDDAGLSAEALDLIIGDTISDRVEVVVTDPGYMRVLNRRYRHIDRTTDVLSFDLAASEDDRPEGTIYVDGRLFPPIGELLERIFHGYLHLTGRTHDTDGDSEAMAEDVSCMVRSAMERSSLSC